jgi:hypothetical protein
MVGTSLSNGRQHPRAAEPGVGAVNVSVFQGGSWIRIGSALLEDISAGGLGIDVEHEIIPESRLRVTSTGVSCTGIVRYCIQREGRFRVGMQFVDLEFTELRDEAE